MFSSDFVYKQHTDPTGFTLAHYPSVDSTNWEAERFAKGLTLEELPVLDQGVVLIADVQTQGQGSHYRKWVSNPGGLYYSLLMAHPGPDAPLQNDPAWYAKLASLAVQETCKLPVEHKFPNDLYYGSHKVGGLLLHSFTVLGKPCLTIGVGINLNQTEFPEEIAGFATSLAKISNQKWRRIDLIRALTQRFNPALSQPQ